MNVLADSNVLVALAQASHPGRASAASAWAALRSAGHTVCVVPQNLYEFWVVATRPVAAGGLGFAPDECKAELDAIRASATLLRDPADLLERWIALAVSCQCRGKPAHDARIAAAMLGCGVHHILTFNIRDFSRFSALSTIDPANPITP